MYVHPADLRHANTRRIFRALVARSPLSRAELARLTGLSSVTAGKIADDLVAAGVCEEIAAPIPGPGADTVLMGRPPRRLTLRPASRFIVIELGVRRTILAPAGVGGSVPPGLERSIPTPGSIDRLIADIRKVRGQLVLDRPLAVLVSVPGVFDEQAANVLYSPNLHWTEGQSLLSELGRVWSAPVLAVQEVQALALGHQAAQDPLDHFLMLDITDGMGGAVVTSGRLLESPLPLAGEIGHTAVAGNSRRCGCGAVGCVETLIGRQGLLHTFRQAARSPRATWDHLRRRVAERGIERWLSGAIDSTGAVIGGAINLMGIRDIVVTGDVPELHPDFVPMLADRVREHSLAGRFGGVRCVLAPSRRRLGLVVTAVERLLLREPEVVGRSNPKLAATG